MKKNTNSSYMIEALKEAGKAYKKDEVPVGAIVVFQNKIIGRGHNSPISVNDPTAHAEIVALRNAAKKIGNYRLTDAILYATMEPCPMCAGAIINARIKQLIFGCPDIKAGACGSVMNITQNNNLNHKVEITAGVLEQDCRAIIQKFFKEKRNKERKNK